MESDLLAIATHEISMSILNTPGAGDALHHTMGFSISESTVWDLEDA